MESTPAQPVHVEASSFYYGNSEIPYQLDRFSPDSGKLGKVTINVHPNCKVVVSAPISATSAEVHDALMKRARWIYNSLEVFRNNLAQVHDKKYVSGEMLFYQGKRYVLKVAHSTISDPQVKMDRGNILVLLPESKSGGSEQIKALVKGWYRERAKQVFKTRMECLVAGVPWIKEIPAVKVRAMQKQWGSCSAQGALVLNPSLVKAPRDCIDYVILHELCHIAEHNHSERFYRLLGRVMPDWKATKVSLDGMAELLLRD